MTVIFQSLSRIECRFHLFRYWIVRPHRNANLYFQATFSLKLPYAFWFPKVPNTPCSMIQGDFEREKRLKRVSNCAIRITISTRIRTIGYKRRKTIFSVISDMDCTDPWCYFN